ncbi:TauD/TfdA family dioxygenase [Pseudemcibacter aquimaris]|uniref:TauD/TfdA family dioxygenase n=1 Tax=Pseudemcibacter aquimaris TaxID=2857064 RepID=UPI002011CAE3|nr:TauD/TfdA family dioxygenase [Pseudemcibacter aquimaris]MCC3862250.1 TauD/TfdA family dioxygenase [Pseudemcibacter aquimaris]WDU59002.1 TauD/TfdA family dioxygenase [Pseudemcibacter aquimaris]
MNVTFKKNRLYLTEPDGFDFTYSALWLREMSDNPAFRDPQTGHKIADADELPLDLEINNLKIIDRHIEITFSDLHQSTYSIDNLREYTEEPTSKELIGSKEYWDSNLDPLPWHDLTEIKNNPEQLLAALNDLSKLGFALIRNVPSEMDGMREFTDLLGPIRTTNNGIIEDIKALPPGDVYDLSMTARALEPHTDNPFRWPQPGYVLLHCLSNTTEGGESGMTDGFRAAYELKKQSPELFDVLCTVPINWKYSDEQAILEDSSTFIELNRNQEVSHVRFHGRSDRVSITDPDKLDLFYKARREFKKLIQSDELEVRFKLKEGDMFIVDNYRIIHRRTAFKPETGKRHMRQAYIDRDVISSRQKVLARDTNVQAWQAR